MGRHSASPRSITSETGLGPKLPGVHGSKSGSAQHHSKERKRSRRLVSLSGRRTNDNEDVMKGSNMSYFVNDTLLCPREHNSYF